MSAIPGTGSFRKLIRNLNKHGDPTKRELVGEAWAVRSGSVWWRVIGSDMIAVERANRSVMLNRDMAVFVLGAARANYRDTRLVRIRFYRVTR